MTVLQKKHTSPIDHLTAEDIENIGAGARRDPR